MKTIETAKKMSHSEYRKSGGFNKLLMGTAGKYSQKGRESLNSPKRGRDNEVASGKNEQEKS